MSARNSYLARGLPLVVLALIAFVAVGGPQMARLGFYHDDWAILSILYFAKPGLWSGMLTLTREMPFLLSRPLNIPLLAGLYALGGLHPLLWQSALLLVNILIAHGVYRLLLRYQAAPRLALIGAALFLVYPNKDATMFWPILITNSSALLFFINATLFQLDYVKYGRGRSLGLAVVALLLSLAMYEQCFFLPLLWIVTPELSRGGLSHRARLSAAAGVAAVGIFALYKFWFVSRILGVPFHKPISLSLEHFFSVYRDGVFVSLGSELGSYVLRAFWSAVIVSPFVAATAIALPWLIFLGKARAESPSRSVPLIVLGLGIFLLGYLPIAVSNYNATAFNHMNRVNQVPILGLVLAAIGLCQSSRRQAWVNACGCGLLSILAATHVAFAGYWTESYRQQMLVKVLIQSHAKQWPVGTTLILALPDSFVRGKAPIFLEAWDLSGAAQIWTEDRKRSANVINAWSDFKPEGIMLRPRSAPLPYTAVMFAQLSGDLFTKVTYKNFRRGPSPSVR